MIKRLKKISRIATLVFMLSSLSSFFTLCQAEIGRISEKWSLLCILITLASVLVVFNAERRMDEIICRKMMSGRRINDDTPRY